MTNPPAPTDPRLLYLVAADHTDYRDGCLQLRRPSSEVRFVRTGRIADLPAVTDNVGFEAVIWLYGKWTRDTPPEQLEAFGLALDTLKDAGVLIDTW